MQLPMFLDRGSGVPLQRQLYDAIRQMVLTGGLRPGHRLPATRELVERLDVSRVAVSLTYDQLDGRRTDKPERQRPRGRQRRTDGGQRRRL